MAVIKLNILSFLAIAACATQCDAKGFRGGDNRTSQADVEGSIAAALAGDIPRDRLEHLEAALRPMFATLPTNADGRLEHQTVRYVLHRFFVQRHAWFIKGLDPGGDTWHTSSVPGTIAQSGWVPILVQDLFEERIGTHGLDLHELAALSAILENIIHKESSKILKDVFDLLEISTEGSIAHGDADLALETYTMIFLKHDMIFSNRAKALQTLELMPRVYKGWESSMNWLSGIKDRHFRSTPMSANGVDFASLARLVEEMGDEFGAYNDHECKDLKQTLTGMEGPSRKAARIRLADFYNASRFTHWKFEEKIDYLRTLGTLDESDASQPLVIAPNYVLSRSNCLQATPLYLVCCRNECEDLMGSLEHEVAAPTASPEQIADVVTMLSSDTIIAPRELPEGLLDRLQQVARAQGGKVHLHSRLFAQWMHHAFPRECPYPHEAGTSNPQTPDEWIKSTGQVSGDASHEEIQKILDTCVSSELDEELPWTHADEILGGQAPEAPTRLFGLVTYMTLGLMTGFGLLYFGNGKLRTGLKQFGAVVMLCWLSMGALSLGLLDGPSFTLEVVIVLVVWWAAQRSESMSELRRKKAKLESDCV